MTGIKTPMPTKSITPKDGLLSAAVLGIWLGGMLTLAKFFEVFDKKGKLLDAEWKLKYNNRGEPRPEYWGDKIMEEKQRIQELRTK